MEETTGNVALAASAAPTTPPARPRSGTAPLAALTAGAASLAGLLLYHGLTTWLEAASFVTGALCVWLTVRQSIWNFPVGMLNVATFAVVFFRARLFADAGLQVAFFVLGAVGWYLWLYGGARHTPLRVTRTPPRRARNVSLAVAILWASLWLLLRQAGGASPAFDSLTTALCLGAQWLLDRKHLENWLLWITVDIIYVPLYLSRGLYLTAALYAVFLCMATIGFTQWRRAYLADRQHQTVPA
jgi:nicotinamide mononucleotide transporter